ncbi:MAG: P-II family nitrogen regulator [Cyclobacteriaceae bacterium]|nr:P-II family nitrogen regulator [Cyclobacteriaceae bacterium]
MKLIVAIIRENQLDQVREALFNADIKRITVSRVSGHGRIQSDEEIYRGKKMIPNLTAGMRIEIALNDEFVDVTIDAIMAAAVPNEDGMVGGGKIFVMPLERCIRIRTHEEGREAI